MTTSILLSYSWKNSDNKLLKSQNSIEDLGLTDLAQKVARKELREDKSTRDQCLQNLRDWIEKNDDIENVRVDDRFLLRFLRVKKFSIPMAQQTLLKYLNLRKAFPHMTCNLDYLGTAMNDIISTGYLYVSPIRDKHGRRIVIACAANFNPKIHSSADMAKVHFLTYEALLDDPENQVLGFSHVGDFGGLSKAHITNWNPTEFGRIMKWGEQSVPIRHKGIHFVNVPTSVKWILDMVKSLVSPKMKERVHAYCNIKELHKHIEPECLPLELGGSIPMKDMIESWKRELSTKRDLLIGLDKMKILNDHGIITRKDRHHNQTNHNSIITNQMESISGSFRKLEFD